MRRVTTQRGRAPVTGPAAWFVRFAGVNSIVCPLGFGGFTIPAIVSVAQGHGILYTFGNPTYGNGPFERIGVPTTVPLLLAFLAACLVQLAGGLLLIWLRPVRIRRRPCRDAAQRALLVGVRSPARVAQRGLGAPVRDCGVGRVPESLT
jgi:hypothetical protein